MDNLKSFDDVVAYCEQQLPEGTFRDYKQQWPGNLEKSIAAMANTQGGIIIVGVKDANDLPIPPYDGFEFKDDHRAKVENLIRHHIVPPLLVDTDCFPNTDKTKCFVVIKVPQSITTPHYLAKDSSVYIRTGQSANPEKIATPDQIGWLFERRKASLELKNTLHERSLDRFDNACCEMGFYSKNSTWPKGIKNSVLNMVACPTFPSEILFDFQDGGKILQELLSQYHINFKSKFTRLAGGGAVNFYGSPTFVPAASGANQQSEGEFDLFEIDEHGFLCQRSPVAKARDTLTGASKPIGYLELTFNIIYFVQACQEFYSSRGYFGFIDFSLHITNTGGNCLDMYRCHATKPLVPQKIIDSDVREKFVLNSADLQTDLLEKICAILTRVSQSCGLEGTDLQLFKTLNINSNSLLDLVKTGRA